MMIVDYLLAAMLTWVPAAHHAYEHESTDHVRARYASIASDATTVAFDPDESPLFDGPDARMRTAVYLLSVASFESFFNQRVDDGRKRGDGGKSWCLMQLHIGSGLTPEGWSGQDLIDDRRRCFRAGLHRLQASFAACHAMPIEDRVSAYLGGQCQPNLGNARARFWRAANWWSNHSYLD